MLDPTYTDPYADTPNEDLKRVQTFIDKSDWLMLRSFGAGFPTTTFGILISRLCTLCRELNITDYTKDNEFKSLVGKLRLSPGTDCPSVLVPRDEYDELKEQSTKYQLALVGGLPNSSAKRTVIRHDGRAKRRAVKGKGGQDTQSTDKSSNSPSSNANGVASDGGSESGEKT